MPASKGSATGSGTSEIVIDPLLMVSGTGTPLPSIRSVENPPGVSDDATPSRTSGNVPLEMPVVSIVSIAKSPLSSTVPVSVVVPSTQISG